MLFFKRWLFCLLPILLTGCALLEPVAPSLSSKYTPLLTRQWLLESIDGKVITPNQDFVTSLKIEEHLTANGTVGCNRYFGKVDIRNEQFRLTNMGSTLMACPASLAHIQSIVSHVLSDWSELKVRDNYLYLTNEQHQLAYRLAEPNPQPSPP